MFSNYRRNRGHEKIQAFRSVSASRLGFFRKYPCLSSAYFSRWFMLNQVWLLFVLSHRMYLKHGSLGSVVQLLHFLMWLEVCQERRHLWCSFLYDSNCQCRNVLSPVNWSSRLEISPDFHRFLSLDLSSDFLHPGSSSPCPRVPSLIPCFCLLPGKSSLGLSQDLGVLKREEAGTPGDAGLHSHPPTAPACLCSWSCCFIWFLSIPDEVLGVFPAVSQGLI